MDDTILTSMSVSTAEMETDNIDIYKRPLSIYLGPHKRFYYGR